MTDAPRRSARNAGKAAPAPTPAAPAKKAAPVKRKSEADSKSDEKKVEKKAKPTAEGQLKVGDKLPSFKLKLQDGKEVDTGDLKRVVLFS